VIGDLLRGAPGLMAEEQVIGSGSRFDQHGASATLAEDVPMPGGSSLSAVRPSGGGLLLRQDLTFEECSMKFAIRSLRDISGSFCSSCYCVVFIIRMSDLALGKPATFVSWYGPPARKLMGLRQPKWPEVLIFQPPVDLDQRDHVAETLTAVIFASKVAGAAKQMSPISVAVSIGEKPSITFCQGRRQALAQPLVTRDQ
jgi:hypothetical protein